MNLTASQARQGPTIKMAARIQGENPSLRFREAVALAREAKTLKESRATSRPTARRPR